MVFAGQERSQAARGNPASSGRKIGTVLSLVALLLVMLPAGSGLAAPLVTDDLTGPLTPEALVNTLLGGGISASNVTYTGAEVAAGTFSGGTGILGLESGIILSSGNIANVIGPNELENVSTQNGTAGDSDLDGLAAFPTQDAAVLEFDFVPSTSRINFQYVFASDEYNEFVNTEFNDVFAFFVNGENCAVVNGDAVSINTINNGNPVGTAPNSHPELYINNDLASGAALDTEMDGLTVVLTCEANVNPGVSNHIKLAIADASDDIYDSNVFLGAGTFAAVTPEFNFFAFLDGSNEVPAVDTTGAGVFGASSNPEETELRFVLVTFNLQETVAAHIHCAAPGVNGPIGVTLFSGGPVTADGTLAQATVTSPDEGNDCGWGSVADVLAALRAGDAYVNVHTNSSPGGEIRGQVVAEDIPAPGSGTFVDDDGNLHEGNIEAIAAAAITLGCQAPPEAKYCPSDSITRGQMAAFLKRTFNLPSVGADRFNDDQGHMFEADINAIAAVGLTIGCGVPPTTTYCPDDPVTREQMASFLVRGLGLTQGAGSDLFVDDNDSVHENDIDILGTSGITMGCQAAPPKYCPLDPVLRDQMASFFARFLQFRPMDPA